MSKKAWIIFVAACVVLLGGLIYLSNQGKLDVSGVDANALQAANENNGNIADHTFGNAKSKVMLVEYGDFQCPGCGTAHPYIKNLTEKYKDQLSFTFRNFPLTSMHPNALTAAAAAEAAGLQGKYWELHNTIFEKQADWQGLSADERTDYFVNLAKSIGLDANKFRTDFTTNTAINQKIKYDQALGKKIGVTGTPQFMLNGKHIDQYVKEGQIVPKGTEGANPIWSDQDALEKLILIPALKEAGIALPKDKAE